VTEVDPQDLADRYVAQWTEPDPDERRKAIERLWTEDGAHILQPPVEIRQTAADLGFDHTTLEARGHDAIENPGAAELRALRRDRGVHLPVAR
jgi:hypothetical protein